MNAANEPTTEPVAESPPPAEPESAAVPDPVDEPDPVSDTIAEIDLPPEDDDAEFEVEPVSAADEAESIAEEPAAEEPETAEAPAPEPIAEAAAVVPVPPPVPDSPRKWYVIKVVSGREESIKAAIERKVKIEGLEEFFGQIVIPVERVTEVKKVKETKNGEKITKEKRVVKEKKKFPGYLMAEVEFNDQILYVFRETNGVGDFVGATGPGKPPPPMSDRDVEAMLYGMMPGEEGKPGPKGSGRPKPKIKIDLEKGDKVRIRDGAFAGMEGEVKEIVEAKDDTETPKMAVEVSIFGRPVKIDNLEYWQIDKV